MNSQVDAYRELKQKNPPVKVAAGEGCNTFHQAAHMMKHGQLDFLQIDVGRIGGVTVADKLCKMAATTKSCHYVNHTYKSHIQLAASLHVLAGLIYELNQ